MRMHIYFAVCVLFSFGLVENSNHRNNETVVWSVCNDRTCSCGHDFKESILCDKNFPQLWVQPCSCIFFDSGINETLFGSCFYTCIFHHISDTGTMYYPIPRYQLDQAHKLNDNVCSFYSRFHRNGQFCGKCEENFGLAVYSYDIFNCVRCHNSYGKWIAFFATAFIPLTLFYLAVLILRISLASSRFNGLVFTIQVLTSPFVQRALIGGLHASNKNSYDSKELFLFKTELTAYGFFNLDFFRAFFPNTCLRSDFTFMHVVSLDLVIALYPFVLIGCTYLLVKMYDYNVCIVIWLWKPFRRIVLRYHQNFQVSTSLIEVFVSFIMLTHIKILGVCTDLLLPTSTYTADGKFYKRYLYFDPTIEYFSIKHLPFAILAITFAVMFVLLPLLFLVLYPCNFFQNFLRLLKLQSHTLQAYMDAFQGSYRIEPHDMRYFSVYYFMFRLVLICLLVIAQSNFLIPTITVVIVVGAVIFAFFQPYQNQHHNRTDVIFLLLLGLVFATYSGLLITSVIAKYYLKTAQVMVIISTTLILLTYLFTVLSRLNVFTVIRRHFIPRIRKFIYQHIGKHQHNQAAIQETYLSNFNESTPLIAT